VKSYLHDDSTPFGSLQSISVLHSSNLLIGTGGKILHVDQVVGDNSGTIVAANMTIVSGNFSDDGIFSIDNVEFIFLDASITSSRMRVLNNGRLVLTEMGKSTYSLAGSMSLNLLIRLLTRTISAV
jgi:hypothetical protein